MKVSERDYAYFRRIGAAKEQSHREAAREHRALPLAERMCRSWELYETFAGASPRQPFDDGPVAFYERARSLGIYEP